MKKQTGWAECPKCKGSGSQLTELSRVNYELWDLNLTMHAKVLYAHVSSGKQWNSPAPEMPDKEYEPCPTCANSEFKGLLPIY